MNTKNEKKGFLEIAGVQTVIASLVCIILGLLVGYIVLLCINPSEAWSAMSAILKNFLYFPRPEVALEYFGSTLAKTAPLLMCTLSILFAYKVGLFNIGASGQYAVGAGLALYLAIAYQMPWYICMIAAMIGGGILGGIAGILKAYLNVNEVIAGIMLNWISLYGVNMLLTNVKESSTCPSILRNISCIIKPFSKSVDPLPVFNKRPGLFHHINQVIVLENIFRNSRNCPGAFQICRQYILVFSGRRDQQIKHFLFTSHFYTSFCKT